MSIVANLLLSFLLSFALVYTIMPVVIRIALRKKLVAEIDDRSSHTELVPTLGGIPIFLAVLLSSFVLVPSPAFGNVQYILAGLLIIFLTGAKDDIEALSARKKTLGLLLGIGILIFAGDIRLQSMYGLFGYYGNLPYLISVALTYFTIFVITNAFNLIDGINGLAGSLGAVVAISFGVWFGMSGLTAYGVLALAMVGGLIAFLRYNVSPAKIFMGDSGSLVLGATCAVFAIKFIDLCFSGNVVTPYCFNHPVAVAISFLIVPLFDTLRVFITRMYRGKSPFRPDRRHIHHLLIDTGRSHTEATIILLLVNITFISLVFALDEVIGMHYILLLEIILATVLTLILHRRARNARIEALNSMVA